MLRSVHIPECQHMLPLADERSPESDNFRVSSALTWINGTSLQSAWPNSQIFVKAVVGVMMPDSSETTMSEHERLT